jgi:hypothetical protein
MYLDVILIGKRCKKYYLKYVVAKICKKIRLFWALLDS